MSNSVRTTRCRLLCLAALTFLVGMVGCQAMRLAQVSPPRIDKEPVPPTPRKGEYRVSQFVFLHDFELNRNLPLFRELAQLREQVYKELQLPPASTPIIVHLFEDRERYERYMQWKHPDLPRRRAFFIAQPRVGGEDLLVFTYWSDRINQDLRHELTHALLHSVLKDVPLWLDEGLAEYFEMPPGWQGINYQHLAQLRAVTEPVKADLARLEQFADVQQMTPAEYREAWAWAHLMLHGNAEGRKVLITYLKELRTNARPGPLRPRLAAVYPALESALERHLARLDEHKPAAATVQRPQ